MTFEIDGRRAMRVGAPATVLALVLTLAAVAGAAADETAPLAPGAALPAIVGRTLAGRDVRLPEAFAGRRALLLLGFTRASSRDVRAWAARVGREYAADTTFVVYEVPMLGGGARLGRPFIERGMRKGIQASRHDQVVPVYRDTGPWKPRIRFVETDIAYLIVVDRGGRVEWTGRGPLADTAYDSLRAVLGPPP